MSLSKTILDTIEINIKKYISQVAKEFKLNEEDLYKLWDNSGEYKTKTVPVVPNIETENEVLDPELMKLNKKELVEICKSKNLPVSGTKNDLVKRISGTSKETKITAVKSTTTSTTSSTSTNKNILPIIKKLVEKIPTIQIRKNSYGNYEHADTGLIFNNSTKRAYGKQNKDGTVSVLTLEDIDICHKFKFGYDIPENLDANKNEEDDIEDELVEEENEELLENEVCVDEEEDEVDDELEDEDEFEEEEELEEYYEDD